MPARTVVSIDSGGHRARIRRRRDELVESHLSLVEGIARGVARDLPSCFDLEDLIGVGNIALVNAATRYRPGDHGGAPFSAYARMGIRGAMLESVRRNRYLEQTRPGLEARVRDAESGCYFDADEGASAMDRMATQPTAETAIDANIQAARLAGAISWLPPDQRQVIGLYYGNAEPSLREVAARLSFGTARTRQLRDAAIEGLRLRFKRAA